MIENIYIYIYSLKIPENIVYDSVKTYSTHHVRELPEKQKQRVQERIMTNEVLHFGGTIKSLNSYSTRVMV